MALRELAALEAAYPNAVTALDYVSPFTLLIAVILSAQCTDARVNLTTPHLFAAYPTPEALANANQEDVERIIKSCGFFRMKAKNIIAAARGLVERHGGDVPDDRDALEALPGVGPQDGERRAIGRVLGGGVRGGYARLPRRSPLRFDAR